MEIESYKEQAMKLILEKCTSSHYWTNEGEGFLRKCDDDNKYMFHTDEPIGKCKPEFCATCQLSRIPLRNAKIETMIKVGKYILRASAFELDKWNEVNDMIPKLEDALYTNGDTAI